MWGPGRGTVTHNRFQRTPDELTCMRKAGQIAAEALTLVEARAREGMTTRKLDEMAETLIRSFDHAEPAFKGLYGFPATLCISLNEEVVHGLPGNRQLKSGDIVSVDVGVRYRGWHSDTARTFGIGQLRTEDQRLLLTTREALEAGIRAARTGGWTGDIGAAIEERVEREGLTVVRQLRGHGIGQTLHQEPAVPNYGEPGEGQQLYEGMTIAIEPMVLAGGRGIRQLKDGWTVVSRDGARSGHFEHTVVIQPDGGCVLTRSTDRARQLHEKEPTCSSS